MTLISDPSARHVEAPPPAWLFPPQRRAFLAERRRYLPIQHTRVAKVLAYGALAVLTVSVAVGALASAFATPLIPVPTASAPTWSVELSSSSSHPVVALAYGPEAGLHIFRVPGTDAAAAPRVILARLAQGELHLMSLGWSGLRARAITPVGARPMSWSAEARTITAFQNTKGTGVSTSW